MSISYSPPIPERQIDAGMAAREPLDRFAAIPDTKNTPFVDEAAESKGLGADVE